MSQTCKLCGTSDEHVAMAMVRAAADGKWYALPRCREHGECWQRVVDSGAEWPLQDRRPRRAVAA